MLAFSFCVLYLPLESEDLDFLFFLGIVVVL